MMNSANYKWLLPVSLTGIILTVLSLTTPSVASDDDDHHHAHEMRASGEIVSLESVLETLKGIRQGKVIETELEEKHGQVVYELELVDADGLVWEYYFDARTGKLLKSEQEDD